MGVRNYVKNKAKGAFQKVKNIFNPNNPTRYGQEGGMEFSPGAKNTYSPVKDESGTISNASKPVILPPTRPPVGTPITGGNSSGGGRGGGGNSSGGNLTPTNLTQPSNQLINQPTTELSIQPTSDYQQRQAYQNRYKMPIKDAVALSFKKFFTPSTWTESKPDKLARARTITDKTGPKIEQPSVWRNVIEPFSYTRDIGESSNYLNRKRGTISPGESSFYTGFETEQQRLVIPEANIGIKRIGYQKKVDMGELTPDQATSQYREEIGNEISQIQSVRDPSLYESKAYKRAKNIPANVESVGIIGGSLVAPAAVGGYLFATGLYKQEKLNKKLAQGYKLDEAKMFGIKYSPEELDVSLRMGFGALTAFQTPVRFANQWTRFNIEEGRQSPSIARTNLFTPDELGTRRGMQISLRKTDGFDQFTKTQFKLTPTDTKTVLITEISSKQTTRYLDVLKELRGQGGWVSKTDTFSGIGKIDPAVFKAVGQDTQASLIKTSMVGPTGRASSRFSGAIQSSLDKRLSLSADVKSLRYYPGDYRTTAKISTKNLLKNIGFTKEKNLYLDDIPKSWGRKYSGGAKTPFSVTFQKQATKQINIQDISPQIFQSTGKQSLSYPQTSFIGSKSKKPQSDVRTTSISRQLLADLQQVSQFQDKGIKTSSPMQGFSFTSKPSKSTRPITNVMVIPGYKPIDDVIQIPKTVSPFNISPPKITPASYIPGFNFKPGFLPLPLPSFSFFDYEGKSRRKSKMFRGKYAPTISAIALNIKTPKISKAYSKGFGALIQRGVLTKSRRKKSGTRKTK